MMFQELIVVIRLMDMKAISTLHTNTSPVEAYLTSALLWGGGLFITLLRIQVMTIPRMSSKATKATVNATNR